MKKKIKVAIFSAISGYKLEQDINGFFTNNPNIELIDIKYLNDTTHLSGMIIYKTKEEI